MSDRFDELWTDFLEGELHEEGFAELDRLLASDEQLRRRAADAYEEHRLLGMVMQESDDEFEAFVGDTLDAVHAEREDYARRIVERMRDPTHVRGTTRRRRWLGYVLVATATLCVALVGQWLFVRSRTAPPDEPLVVTPVQRPINYVATLVRAEKCRWSKVSGGPPVEGSRLAVGELRLEAGVAVIRFDAGASAVLSGPAELRIDSPDTATLSSGRVTLRAPQEAAGFALTTLASDFVDLGTEFAVSVEKSGATELHVHEGAVEVHRRGRQDDEGKLIEEGQALRFATPEAESAEPIALSAPRFGALLAEASSRRDRGRLLAYEGFDYDSETEQNANGGFGWSSHWHRGRLGGEDLLCVAPEQSLHGPAQLESPQGGSLACDKPPRRYSQYKRQVQHAVDLSADGIRYLSFLVRPTAERPDAERATANFVWMSNESPSVRVSFGVLASGHAFVYARCGGNSLADEPLRVGETYLFVGKMVTSAIGSDQLFLKVFESDDTIDPREPETWTVVGRPTELDASLDAVHVMLPAPSGCELDEIRIGTTWESVTPFRPTEDESVNEP